MAIYLYSGTPGSGKSLHAAKTIIEWFHKGKPVITNFELDLTKFPGALHSSVDDDELTPDFLATFSQSYFADRKIGKKDEDTILLVIDECQLMFNSREYQKKDRKIWIKFFTQHRKLGYRVILIAQMDKMLDKQIRGVIEYEYIHRKLSNFGKAGKLLSFLMMGETFTAVQMWYPLKLKIGNTMFRAKKKYFSIYDSYVTFGDPKSLPAADQSADQSAHEEPAEPAQAETPAPELSDPEVKQGEIVDPEPKRRIWFRLPELLSPLPYQGKYLRPGGRSETGWR